MKAEVENCYASAALPYIAVKTLGRCLEEIERLETLLHETALSLDTMTADRDQRMAHWRDHRPPPPTRVLQLLGATSEQILEHYLCMSDYWIADIKWLEAKLADRPAVQPGQPQAPVPSWAQMDYIWEVLSAVACVPRDRLSLVDVKALDRAQRLRDALEELMKGPGTAKSPTVQTELGQ